MEEVEDSNQDCRYGQQEGYFSHPNYPQDLWSGGRSKINVRGLWGKRRGPPTFAAGQQEVLFSMADYQPSNGNPMYTVSPDDQRFVMLRMGDEAAGSAEAYLVTNWFEELRQRMGN